MKLNPEDRGLQGLSTFISLILLNVLYLVLCVPIVTIGAATTALYEVMIRFSDEESGRPLNDFLPAFARNFVRATALWLTCALPLGLLVVSAVFWLTSPSTIGLAAALLSGLAAAYVLAATLYAFALAATHVNTFRQTLKNAFLLPFAEPVRTLAIVLIPVTLLALSVIMPPFTIILATIGCSVGAYGTAFLLRGVFRRHQPAA